jgi:hypothetical protein
LLDEELEVDELAVELVVELVVEVVEVESVDSPWVVSPYEVSFDAFLIEVYCTIDYGFSSVDSSCLALGFAL